MVLKENYKIVGIVTERDIVRAVSKGISRESPTFDIVSKNIIKSIITKVYMTLTI